MKLLFAIVAFAAAALAIPEEAGVAEEQAGKRCRPGTYRCDGRSIDVCTTEKEWVVSGDEPPPSR